MRRRGPLLFLGVAILLLASCPHPFDPELSRQASDTTPPVIGLDAPEDGSTFRSSVTIVGSVSDGEAGRVASLTLLAPAAGIEEPLVLGSGGTFAYTFSTAGISTAVVVTLRALDWNGNVAERVVTLFRNDSGPFVEITEPANLSSYASVVRVAGRVLDAEGAATTNQVNSVTYRVPGTSIAGTLTLAADGHFSFVFLTKDSQGRQLIDGTRIVEVTASDWNLNLTTAAVTILRDPAGGDIPSFAATAESETVTFSWEPVVDATNYVLDSLRDGAVRSGVTSPYTWTGLTNGTPYSFRLRAEINGGADPDSWSVTRDVIPLGSRSLAPWVKAAGHRSITIEWRDMAADSEYLVEQSEAGGPWQVKATTAATVYQATGLALDTWYAYRVSPFGRQDVVGAEAWGMASRFGPGGAALAATTNTPPTPFGVAVAGSYAYVAGESRGLLIFDVSNAYAPVLVGTYDTAGYSYDVAVAGSYAYVADYDAGLRIIDVSNPSAPSLVST